MQGSDVEDRINLQYIQQGLICTCFGQADYLIRLM